MLDSLRSLLDVESFGWRDALDILLVALLVYGVIMLLRRTRGAPVAIGVLLFIAIWWLAVQLELQTLGTILDVALTSLPFVVVLLFQNTIRRALTALGRNPLFRLFGPGEDQAVVEDVALAAISLASQRLGALIVFEREVGLRTYIGSGMPVDARPSYELLLAIFHPKSPLHDGAVVIAQGRVAAASCLLPLTTKPVPSGKLGSRHRAALGLSEETDALVVVVSEERGIISLVKDGELRPVEGRELRELLARELGPVPAAAARAAVARS
jgi:diadenylate cyclase